MLYGFKKSIVSLSAYYKADLRALSLLRIGMALVVIADLLIRARDLTAHYTDKGLWATALVPNFGWQQGFWSLHTLNGNYFWAFTLFLLAGTLAVFLLLGCYTKIVCPVLWLLTISLHNRNVFVLQSGDDLLRLMLLWGCFLPWQYYYSIDGKKISSNQAQFSVAYVGYLVLIASVYFFTAILKTSPEWHEEGTAVYYALSLDQMKLPGFGDWLYQYPGLMKFLTRSVYYIELLIPMLILWPSKRGITRLLAFILIIFIQTGFGLSLYVGLFFVISMVSALGLLPSFVMDGLSRGLQNLNKRKSNIGTRIPVRKNKTGILYKTIFNTLSVLLIVFSIIINLSGTIWFSYELVPELSQTVNTLRLNQYWGMFSPTVMKKDGWFVYHGVDSLGRQYDLRLKQDYVDYSKPAHIVNMYRSDRWRKLTENMQDERFSFLRPQYCKFILRTWNKNHPEKKLATLNLYYMEELSLPNYKVNTPEKKLYSVCTND